MTDDRIQQMHSYALARIMKHVIGYDNFNPADHAIHGMLIDHKSGTLTLGNVNETLKDRAASYERIAKSLNE